MPADGSAAVDSTQVTELIRSNEPTALTQAIPAVRFVGGRLEENLLTSSAQLELSYHIEALSYKSDGSCLRT